MTIKHFAKTAGYAMMMFFFPVKPKANTEKFDIDAHIEQVQASFCDAVKDDLKPNV